MSKLNFNQKNAIISSFLISILLLTTIIVFEFVLYSNYVENRKSQVELKYNKFEKELKKIIHNSIDVTHGFNVYLSTVQDLDEKTSFKFLDSLLSDKDNDIVNIEVFKDTVELWHYSVNKDEIIEFENFNEQVSSISSVKNSLESTFQGPLKLENGTNVFIVRTPIIREDVYWGQTSIVINADDITDILNDIGEFHQIKVMIINEDKSGESGVSKQVIYDNGLIKDDKNLEFYIDDNFIDWKFFVQPKLGWKEQRNWLIIFPFATLLLSIFIGYKYYAIITNTINTRSKANHDQLTGLYNRTYLDKHFSRVINVSELNKLNTGLILINIDKFKEFNEKHGHRIGDLVLIKFSDKLKALLRNRQEVFRIGGDEFLFVIEDVDTRDKLDEIKNRLVESISDKMTIEGIMLNVTASAGTGYYPEDGNNLETLLETAYDSRYRKK